MVLKYTQIAKFMEPTWVPPGSQQMGPMMAPWTLLSGHSPRYTHLAWQPLISQYYKPMDQSLHLTTCWYQTCVACSQDYGSRITLYTYPSHTPILTGCPMEVGHLYIVITLLLPYFIITTWILGSMVSHKRIIVGLSQSVPAVGCGSLLHAWLALVNWIDLFHNNFSPSG